MAPAKEREYTVDDVYAMKDGTRAELIDGEIYMLSAPDRRHQRISGRIYQRIANYIDSRNGEYEVY